MFHNDHNEMCDDRTNNNPKHFCEAKIIKRCDRFERINDNTFEMFVFEWCK